MAQPPSASSTTTWPSRPPYTKVNESRLQAGEAGALRAQLANERGSGVPGASALTAAELRLLPLLSTHLSVPEIAAELFLSPHTIKSQMKSIYRKLNATTRNQAVTQAREQGLLEG